MNQTEKLPLIRKVGYGVGDAGSNYCWSFVASFLMLYCTNVLGISAAVIGTLMLFSRVLDGVSDIIMGRIIDATHSKMGKARFWYLVSTFPTAIFTFLLFNVPGSFTENTKYIYIFIVYTLLGAVFYTANNIAYSSLVALCTKNPKDRVQMGSYRFLFAAVAILVMSYTTSGLVDMFGGGQRGWTMVSLIYSLVCLVLLLVPFFAVKELPEDDSYVKKGNEKKSGTIIKDLVALFRNKYFLMILTLYLVMYLGTGITQGMGIYFATYQLGNASLLGVISSAAVIPVIIMMFIVPNFASKFGMRKSILLGHSFGVIGGVVLIIGTLTVQFPIIILGIVMIKTGASPQTGSLNALIAETDEYSYLKFGRRMTGTIYSCSSVGIKVGTGIGTAVCGFLLDFGGFDGTAAVQTARAISTIKWSYVLALALVPLLSLIIFYFMKVEKENKELREKKEQ